ncbi:MAG: GHKL domain-containing protein [Eubacterium sp.]|nr:GHKL domain-containing protein [Eubacterium sp.]
MTGPDRQQFLIEFISYMVFFPAALVCLLPMRNHSRLNRYNRTYQLAIGAGLLLLILAASFIGSLYPFDTNLLTIPILIIVFIAYHRCQAVHISKSLSVFVYACALMSFMANYASEFDALLHPDAAPDSFSIEGGLFQFVISCLLVLALAYPLRIYGSRLIDSLHDARIWNISILISGIFLVFNIFFIPHNYRTLYTNKVFRTHFITVSLLLCLMLLLSAIFYYIVETLQATAKTKERNRILEMQEKQYITQQRYMEDTARVRHDFRQTVHALQAMSQAQDYDGIAAYLDKYIKALPQKEYVRYCNHNALNALLNHYAQAALAEHIELNWRIELPGRKSIEPWEADAAIQKSNLPVSDVELCSIIGNILENAIYACREIPEESRYIELSVTVHQQAQLCIVASNSFSGNVKKRDGKYLSTHRKGNGIGLASIASTAEHYGGVSTFSHNDREFCSNVMIPM